MEAHLAEVQLEMDETARELIVQSAEAEAARSEAAEARYELQHLRCALREGEQLLLETGEKHAAELEALRAAEACMTPAGEQLMERALGQQPALPVE